MGGWLVGRVVVVISRRGGEEERRERERERECVCVSSLCESTQRTQMVRCGDGEELES